VKHELKSKSKRTEITVELEDDGKLLILVDRDGQRLLSMPFEKEPIPKSGLGN
jgi:hypothetical protein